MYFIVLPVGLFEKILIMMLICMIIKEIQVVLVGATMNTLNALPFFLKRFTSFLYLAG
jgi:hypothetical protein